jgi:hypothetical protein
MKTADSTVVAAGACRGLGKALYWPKADPRGDGGAALRVADGLSFGATPTFAFMATITGILGGDLHELLCSAASHSSVLSGMVPMYVLMSASHSAPWLKLISRWRSGTRAAGLTQRAACSGHSRNKV